ncbi:MAG: DUF2177 family protein [Burkholderiales bacterium]|nr:MAG: DUF2177 family protein [Burkholderiales bacterium]
MGLLDAMWLGVLARDFYRQEIGVQMVAQVRWLPAALFYFGYPAALVVLALLPAGQPRPHQVARAALVGLVGYGVYDASNLATLQFWTAKLAVVDTAWGVFASTLAGAAASAARQPA